MAGSPQWIYREESSIAFKEYMPNYEDLYIQQKTNALAEDFKEIKYWFGVLTVLIEITL